MDVGIIRFAFLANLTTRRSPEDGRGGKNLTRCGMCHQSELQWSKQGSEVWWCCQGPRQEWRPSGGGGVLSGQCNLDTIVTLKVTDPD